MNFGTVATVSVVFAVAVAVGSIGGFIFLTISDAVQRARRSRFLDSLGSESINTVFDVAEKIRFLFSSYIILPPSYQKKYLATSLGRFVESLLNCSSDPMDYTRVADFLVHTRESYQKQFLGAMTRHREVQEQLIAEFKRRKVELEDEKQRRNHETRFQKGLRVCGYKPPEKKKEAV